MTLNNNLLNYNDLCDITKMSSFNNRSDFTDSSFNESIFQLLSSDENQKVTLQVIELYLDTYNVPSEIIFNIILSEISKCIDSNKGESSRILENIIKKLLIDYEPKGVESLITLSNLLIESIRKSFKFYYKYYFTYCERFFHKVHHKYCELLNKLIEDISTQSNEDLLLYIDVLIYYLQYHSNENINNLEKCSKFIMNALKDKNIQFSEKALFKILKLCSILLDKFNINWILSDNYVVKYHSIVFLQNYSIILNSFLNVTMTIRINESYEFYPKYIQILLNYLIKINEDEVDFSENEVIILQSILSSISNFQNYIKKELLDINNDIVKTEQFWIFMNCYGIILKINGHNKTEFCHIIKIKLNQVINDNINVNNLFSFIIESIFDFINDLDNENDLGILTDPFEMILNKYELYIIENNDVIKLLNILSKLIHFNKINHKKLNLFINKAINNNNKIVYNKLKKVTLLKLFLEYYFQDENDNLLKYDDILIEWLLIVLMNVEQYASVYDVIVDKLVFPLAKSGIFRDKLRQKLLKSRYNGPLLHMLVVEFRVLL